MIIDNPILNENAFDKYDFGSSDGSAIPALQISRTALKVLFCALLVLVSSILASRYDVSDFSVSLPYYFLIPLLFIPLLLQVSSQPLSAPIVAPIFSIIQGIFLGLSAKIVMGWNFSLFSSFLDWFLQRENSFPGLQLCSHSEVFFCAICVVIVMSIACVTRLIKPKQTMIFSMFGAAAGPLLFYASAFIAHQLGFHFIRIHNEIIYMIACFAFSCLLCLPIAYGLAIDFYNITLARASEVPYVMEWYCAAGVIFTIIWAYIQLPVLLFILCMKDDRYHRYRRNRYYNTDDYDD
ncbi:MAG: Bax inhibitor-1/YccA family protein [bacterium]|nr:Bax inhibitor-1/YccA family protein [bacterium]